jgi:hypothetical protein
MSKVDEFPAVALWELLLSTQNDLVTGRRGELLCLPYLVSHDINFLLTAFAVLKAL